MIPFIWHPGKGKTTGRENRPGVNDIRCEQVYYKGVAQGNVIVFRG